MKQTKPFYLGKTIANFNKHRLLKYKKETPHETEYLKAHMG